MEIKKIVNFSDTEFKILTDAGQLLGAVKKAFENGEIDALSDGAKNILAALDKVLDEVITK